MVGSITYSFTVYRYRDRETQRERNILVTETERQRETDSPNIHTSLAEVKRLKFMDSGAIHLIGSFPLEAEEREKMTVLEVAFQFTLSVS